MEIGQTGPRLVPQRGHAGRILKAFSDIALTLIEHAAGEDILRRLHPCQGYRRTSCNGWDGVLLSTGSLKFRQLEPDGANGEI